MYLELLLFGCYAFIDCRYWFFPTKQRLMFLAWSLTLRPQLHSTLILTLPYILITYCSDAYITNTSPIPISSPRCKCSKMVTNTMFNTHVRMFFENSGAREVIGFQVNMGDFPMFLGAGIWCPKKTEAYTSYVFPMLTPERDPITTWACCNLGFGSNIVFGVLKTADLVAVCHYIWQAWKLPPRANRILHGNLSECGWIFHCHCCFEGIWPCIFILLPKILPFSFASICHAISVFGWLLARGGDDRPYHHLYRWSDHQRFGGREIEGKIWLQTKQTWCGFPGSISSLKLT